LFQGVACYYSVAALLLEDCVEKFNKMRDNADYNWQKLINETKQFAVEYDLEPYFPAKRLKRTKRIPGEMVLVTTYIPALDSVHIDLRNRFTDMAVYVLR